MAIPSQINPVGEYEAFIHAMIIGAPGFGKTVFAGTAEKALFLTTDPEGTVSALAFGSTAQEWRIDTWDELNEAYRYLRDGGIEEMGLNWVIIDNVSEAQNLGMAQTMFNNRRPGRGGGNRDEFVPGVDEHQRSQLMLKSMVKQFHDLPVNILWTSWRKSELDGEGETYYTSGIHGQQGLLAQTIQGYMNVVGFGEVVEDDGKEHRRLFFKQAMPYMGKDRYVALPKVVDDYSVPKMENAINVAKKKHKAAQAAALSNKPTAAKRTARTATPNTKVAPRRVARKKA